MWCSLVLLCAVIYLIRDREPYYKSRPLSAWLVSYHEDTSEEAAEAIRQIGTNAIPHMLKWIRYDQPKAKSEWLRRINIPIDWLHNKFSGTTDWSVEDHDQLRGWGAAEAFSLLQPHANLAVTELDALLKDNPHSEATRLAGQALANLGPAGLPPLMAALEGTNSWVRIVAIENIARLGTNARPAVPLLVKALDKIPDTEFWAIAQALGNLRLDLGITVPALVNLLSSTNLAAQYQAAIALGQLASLARPAIPALIQWLNSNDPRRQFIATNVLHSIDPLAFPGQTSEPAQ